MRRWRQGEGCGRGGWAAPRKKYPQNDKLGCIFSAIFNRQKTRKPWDTDFTVQSRNYKAYKNSAKLSKNSRSNQGGGCTVAPPLNTPLKSSLHSGAGNCHA